MHRRRLFIFLHRTMTPFLSPSLPSFSTSRPVPSFFRSIDPLNKARGLGALQAPPVGKLEMIVLKVMLAMS